MNTRSSSIAFTGSMAAVDIPNKHRGRDSLIAVAARSYPATHALPLPTPPNSISPSLPPAGFQGQGISATPAGPALDHVESDLDLQDAPSLDVGSPSCDAAGTITPALLARHHLPDILLTHGPLAIRYIMGHLTIAVPGFSGIPPAKARRLVVGALEGRGSNGEGGGLHGEVMFEKVGWGRWDARLKSQAIRSGGFQESFARLSPPASVPSSLAPTSNMPIASRSGDWSARPRLDVHKQSWTESFAHSYRSSSGIPRHEEEADKMSLDDDDDDGNASCSSSEAPPDEEIMDMDDPEDMTDDEDWAAMGAAKLREASISVSGPGTGFLSSHVYTSGGGGHTLQKPRLVHAHTFDPKMYEMAMRLQEQEAAATLASLKSL